MIYHTSFENDARRIAKHIIRDVNNPMGETIAFGHCSVHVSQAIMDEYREIGKKRFLREINKHLTICRAELMTQGMFVHPVWTMVFSISW